MIHRNRDRQLAPFGLVLVALFCACAGKDADPPSNGGTYPTDYCHPDSVYFGNTVQPFLVANCAIASCHDTGANGVLLSYADAAPFVTPGDTANSPLYATAPHWPVDSLVEASMDSLGLWIMQGAQDNACTP